MNNNYPIYLKSDANISNNSFIVFTIKNKRYAINIQNVLEVINIPEIQVSSKSAEGIIGMFNYKGMIIKAVDLCPFLGFETPPFSVNSQLIIILADDNCFAVHTEKIENIIRFNMQNIQSTSFNLEDSIIKEVYKDENELVNIVDINILYRLISENHSKESHIKYEDLFSSDEKSKQILELRIQQNKTPQEIFSFPVNLSSTNQYILFTLDNHNYYLDLKHIKEVISIKRLNITKLPYTQDFIKGMINLKGDFLVVIDLKRFLNNDINDIKEGSKLIITEGKDFNIALLVDEIKSIKNLKNMQKTNSYFGCSPYIYMEYTENDTLYSILNFEKIINDERIYINIM